MAKVIAMHMADDSFVDTLSLLPGGFTYFMHELVFYSWFFGIPATGSGGLFSDNGTFATGAGAVCH